jgi:hypothetical protein
MATFLCLLDVFGPGMTLIIGTIDIEELLDGGFTTGWS